MAGCGNICGDMAVAWVWEDDKIVSVVVVAEPGATADDTSMDVTMTATMVAAVVEVIQRWSEQLKLSPNFPDFFSY